MKATELKSILKPHTFWDVRIEDIDFGVHKRFVIERVFTRGSEAEIAAIRQYYSQEEITDSLKMIRCMDHLTLNYVSRMYQIPIEQFRCYEGKPLDRNYRGY